MFDERKLLIPRGTPFSRRSVTVRRNVNPLWFNRVTAFLVTKRDSLPTSQGWSLDHSDYGLNIGAKSLFVWAQTVLQPNCSLVYSVLRKERNNYLFTSSRLEEWSYILEEILGRKWWVYDQRWKRLRPSNCLQDSSFICGRVIYDLTTSGFQLIKDLVIYRCSFVYSVGLNGFGLQWAKRWGSVWTFIDLWKFQLAPWWAWLVIEQSFW